MKLPRRKFLHLAAGAAAMPGVSRVSWAQAYPSRPVRIIVPFAPNGPSDVFARLTAQKLTEQLRNQFYVENIAGANTNVGTVMRRRPHPTDIRYSSRPITLLSIQRISTVFPMIRSRTSPR